MHEFDFESVTTLNETLDRIGETNRVLAGGTDLLTRLKIGLDQPESLLDIKATELPSGVSADSAGFQLGALCTLSDIENAELLDARYQLLKDAASQAATQQIRNRATIAGNLLQSPRCWYYRHPDINCWRKGGEQCPARSGQNRYHAVVDHGLCEAVHPSDIAACLIALDATVDVRSRDGEHRTSVADFLTSPTEQHRTETALQANEVITAINIPPLDVGSTSCYLKAMDRKAWAFALSGVAAVVTLHEGCLKEVRLCLSGVANTPYRLTAVEDMLTGHEPTTELVATAASLATENFEPLSDNAYKVDLVQGLVKSALERLLIR